LTLSLILWEWNVAEQKYPAVLEVGAAGRDGVFWLCVGAHGIRLCREFCDVLQIVSCMAELCRLRLVLGM